MLKKDILDMRGQELLTAEILTLMELSLRSWSGVKERERFRGEDGLRI